MAIVVAALPLIAALGGGAGGLSEGDVRLVRPDATVSRGRVEIMHEGAFGTICSNHWELEDAEVVCRQLGLGAAIEAKRGWRDGPDLEQDTAIWMTRVDCDGHEARLSECARGGDEWGGEDCDHDEDAGAACSGCALPTADEDKKAAALMASGTEEARVDGLCVAGDTLNSGDTCLISCPDGYINVGDTDGKGSCRAGVMELSLPKCLDVDECVYLNGGCSEHRECTNLPGSFECGPCEKGFVDDGNGGCTDINECIDGTDSDGATKTPSAGSGPCAAQVECTNTPGGFSCSDCPPGFAGSGYTDCTDVDECASNNGGCGMRECYNTVGSFSCGGCPAGLALHGQRCVDINECKTSNGGCDPLASCTNTFGGRICGPCPAGYRGTGDAKCTDIDECKESPEVCHELSTCTNTAGSFECSNCPVGYLGHGGSGCIDIDECKVDNGGCHILAKCINEPGGRKCGPCPLGYEGDGETCADVDECSIQNGDALGPCSPLAICSNTPGSFLCGPCPPGFKGSGYKECIDVDECAVANGGCDPRVECINNIGGRACGDCPPGFLISRVATAAMDSTITTTLGVGLYEDGGRCLDIDECQSLNGGCDSRTQCTNLPGSFECSPCPLGFQGDGLTGCFDHQPPRGYSLEFEGGDVGIVPSMVSAVYLTVFGAEIGAHFEAVVISGSIQGQSSAGSGRPVMSSGVVADNRVGWRRGVDATEGIEFRIGPLDLAGLASGVVTAKVWLTDESGNRGVVATANAQKLLQLEARYIRVRVRRSLSETVPEVWPTKGLDKEGGSWTNGFSAGGFWGGGGRSQSQSGGFDNAVTLGEVEIWAGETGKLDVMVVASSSSSALYGAGSAGAAVDGDPDVCFQGGRGSSEEDGEAEWLLLDLGRVRRFSEVRVYDTACLGGSGGGTSSGVGGQEVMVEISMGAAGSSGAVSTLLSSPSLSPRRLWAKAFDWTPTEPSSPPAGSNTQLQYNPTRLISTPACIDGLEYTSDLLACQLCSPSMDCPVGSGVVACTGMSDTHCAECVSGLTFAPRGKKCRACTRLDADDCPAGHELVPCSPTRDAHCKPCTEGSAYSPFAGAPCRACSDPGCSAGFGTVTCTHLSDAFCQACEPGLTWSPGGGSPCSRCSPPPTDCPKGQKPVGCTAGQDAGCTPCVGGFSAGWGEGCKSWSVDVVCGAGEGFVSGTATADAHCEACRAGVSFSTGGRNEQCEPCTAVVCGPGQELDPCTPQKDATCRPCVQGDTYSPGNGGRCRPCSRPIALSKGESDSGHLPRSKAGATNIEEPSWEERGWRQHKRDLTTTATAKNGGLTGACPAGSMLRACTPISDATCEKCVAGRTFSPSSGDQMCLPCSRPRCGPGFEHVPCTVTRDTSCRSCGAGVSFSVDDHMPCTPCSKVSCRPGTQPEPCTPVSDMRCVECRPGTFSPDGTECRVCSRGAVMTKTALVKQASNDQGQCSAGFEVVDCTATSDGECRMCVLGRTYSPDGRSCRPCTRDVACPAGFERVSCSLRVDATCRPCPAGSFSPGDGGGCRKCSARPSRCPNGVASLPCTSSSDAGCYKECPAGGVGGTEGECSGRGECDHASGQCRCRSPFGGERCDGCAATAYLVTNGWGGRAGGSGRVGDLPTCKACSRPECGIGEELMPCTVTADAYCRNCQDGVSFADTAGGPCRLCSPAPATCPPGHIVVACTSTHDANCSACPDGRFERHNTCVPCSRHRCPRGYEIRGCAGDQDSACEACGHGEWSPGGRRGQAQCKLCSALTAESCASEGKEYVPCRAWADARCVAPGTAALAEARDAISSTSAVVIGLIVSLVCLAGAGACVFDSLVAVARDMEENEVEKQIRRAEKTLAKRALTNAGGAGGGERPALVRALFTFSIEDERTLPFKEGDVLEVLGEAEEGWAQAVADGRTGLIPLNHVEDITDPSSTEMLEGEMSYIAAFNDDDDEGSATGDGGIGSNASSGGLMGGSFGAEGVRGFNVQWPLDMSDLDPVVNVEAATARVPLAAEVHAYTAPRLDPKLFRIIITAILAPLPGLIGLYRIKGDRPRAFREAFALTAIGAPLISYNFFVALSTARTSFGSGSDGDDNGDAWNDAGSLTVSLWAPSVAYVVAAVCLASYHGYRTNLPTPLSTFCQRVVKKTLRLPPRQIEKLRRVVGFIESNDLFDDTTAVLERVTGRTKASITVSLALWPGILALVPPASVPAAALASPNGGAVLGLTDLSGGLRWWRTAGEAGGLIVGFVATWQTIAQLLEAVLVLTNMAASMEALGQLARKPLDNNPFALFAAEGTAFFLDVRAVLAANDACRLAGCCRVIDTLANLVVAAAAFAAAAAVGIVPPEILSIAMAIPAPARCTCFLYVLLVLILLVVAVQRRERVLRVMAKHAAILSSKRDEIDLNRFQEGTPPDGPLDKATKIITMVVRMLRHDAALDLPGHAGLQAQGLLARHTPLTVAASGIFILTLTLAPAAPAGLAGDGFGGGA